MAINWNPLSWGDEAAGAGKWLGRQIYESTPIDNVGRAYGAARSGDWGKFAKEVGIGTVEGLALALGGGAALRAGGGLANLGARQASKQFVKGAFLPGRLPSTAFSGGKPARALAAIAGPVTPIGAVGLGGLNLFLDRRTGQTAAGGPQVPLGSRTPGTPATGTLTGSASGMAGSGAGAGMAGAGAGSGGSGPSVRGGLVGLTPEQISVIAMQERALQREYDDLMNQFLLQERQGRQEEGVVRSAARREAAGAAQDLGTQLAASGLGLSPASAISAEESVARARQQQEAAAIRGLSDILAQIESGRTSAKSNLRKGKTSVKQARKEAQIANTLAQQAAFYNMFGGA